MPNKRIWECKIGESLTVPRGADWPMRKAIAAAYRSLTGKEPDFIFSGWGATLTEPERAVVEDREPEPDLEDTPFTFSPDEREELAAIVGDHALRLRVVGDRCSDKDMCGFYDRKAEIAERWAKRLREGDDA